MSEFIYWEQEFNLPLLVHILIVIGLFTSLRLFSGTLAHMNASDELTKKDNPAFGISMMGVIIGVSIILNGAIFESSTENWIDSAITIAVYGVLGIIFMAITRLIFDKLALTHISIRDEIAKGNIAAGFIDAGNVIATSIILQAVMMWIPGDTINGGNFEGIGALVAGYVISQTILTLSTYARVKLYSRRHPEGSLEEAFRQGNAALAIRFSGRKISSAFAITAASYLVLYEIESLAIILAVWAAAAILMIILFNMVSIIADKIILFGVNAEAEITQERNMGIAAVQASIYVTLAMLLMEFIK